MTKIKFDNVPDFLVWNKIKSLRKEKQLTQPEVAVGASISISTLWAIESGYDEKTTKEIKRKLAKFFKCEIEDIFPAQMIGNQTRAEVLNNKQSKKD